MPRDPANPLYLAEAEREKLAGPKASKGFKAVIQSLLGKHQEEVVPLLKPKPARARDGECRYRPTRRDKSNK